MTRVRYKPFDWLNVHLRTKGKNAFLVMINDCRGDEPSTYMGFIFMEGGLSSLFSFSLTLSFILLTLINGLMGSDRLQVKKKPLTKLLLALLKSLL